MRRLPYRANCTTTFRLFQLPLFILLHLPYSDQHGNFMARISRKLVSDSFYQHEIEEELRERGLSWSFHGDDNDALTSVLRKLNEIRSSELYPHSDAQCSEACAAKG